MKTEELISVLASEAGPGQQPRGSLGAFLIFSGAISTALLLLFIGVRNDLYPAFGRATVLAKPLLGAILFATALWAAVAAGQPARLIGARIRALWAAPALAALLFIVGSVSLEERGFTESVIGMPGSLRTCLIGLPLLSLPGLVACLAAIRTGAHTSSGISGALAGASGAGIGVMIYSLACREDSPLFYSLWYTVVALAIAGLGAVLGRSFLRL